MAFNFFKKKKQEAAKAAVTENAIKEEASSAPVKSDENPESNENVKTNENAENAKAREEAFFRQLEERRKTDPLIGAKLCGMDMYNKFVNIGKDPDGRMNCASFLFNIGCFAGFVCQAAVWKKYVIDAKKPPESVFAIIGTKSGRNYYFGDQLNKFVGEGKYSFWSLVGGMIANVYPDTPVPDVLKIVEKVSQVIGNEDYKICGAVEPDKAVKQNSLMWKGFYPLINKYCPDPEEWPTAMGIAAQNAVKISKDVLSQEQCFNLLMESAVYMSKMDISKIVSF